MKIKYLIIPLVLILLLASTGSVLASGKKLGTSAAAELTIPMGAQNIGIGGSNIANVGGTEAMYWNPAGLSRIQGGEASFNYLNYFADMSVSYIALGTSMGKMGMLGLSLQSLSIGDINVTTIENPEGTGEVLNPNFMTLNGTFARQFTDRINFGLNAKLIYEKVGNMSASAVAFDFGLQYLSPWGVDFGVVMRNYGSRMKYDGTGIEFNTPIEFANPNATTRKTKLDMASQELPASLTMGLAYGFKLKDWNKLNVSASYTSASYGLEMLNGGIECCLKDMFFARAGYNLPLYPEGYPEAAKEYQYGLSFGFGAHILFNGKSINADYGYRLMDQFSGQNFFSIGVGW